MSIWNYQPIDISKIISPVSIVNDACRELSELSGGMIIARITEYEGKYKSTPKLLYVVQQPPESSVATESSNEETFNVQNIMGGNISLEDYNNQFVYELYITSKKTPNYKYRVLILYHDIQMYPVGLTIQEDIAKEIGCKSEGIQCKDEASFRETLGNILGSNTIGVVLRNLAALNQNI